MQVKLKNFTFSSLFLLLCMLLSACNSSRNIPDYRQGSGIPSKEAIGVFRVIHAKHNQSGFLSLFASQTNGGTVCIQGPKNNVIYC